MQLDFEIIYYANYGLSRTYTLSTEGDYKVLTLSKIRQLLNLYCHLTDPDIPYHTVELRLNGLEKMAVKGEATPDHKDYKYDLLDVLLVNYSQLLKEMWENSSYDVVIPTRSP